MTDGKPASVEADAERPLVRRIVEETSRFALIQTFASILGWVANVGLARLLERRDFGVFGIATFYIGLGNLLGSGGLGATLLRRKGGVDPAEYQSTVTAMLCIAGGFALALFVFAPWIGRANEFSPAEIEVLRAMSPLYFVGALRLTPYVRLERELAFSAIARIELAAGVTKHVVALTIAGIFGSVWALVMSQLSSAVVQLLLAYRASPGWAGLGFSWRIFRPLFAYGSKVQGLAIFAYFKDNVSRALLGTTAGPSAVGTYDFAMGYIQVPVVAVNSLARVQLPVYARLERDDPDLFSALRGAMRIALLAGIPLIAILAFGGPWLISFIYGEKWLPSLPIAWALVLNMVCGLVTSPLFTLLQGQGRAGLALIAFGLWTLGTWLLSFLMLAIDSSQLALIGAAQSVATLVITIFLLNWASRHLQRRLMPELASPVLAGLAAFGTGILMVRYGHGPLAHPVALAFESFSVYLVVLLGIDGRRVKGEARALLKNLLGSKAAKKA